MSSCLSGGAYTLELEMMKSPSSRAVSSHNTPSPSSTISESNSPPLTISTRRPRTQRKRPNQTYDEAEALLSNAYPNIFSSKRKSPLNHHPLFLNDYDEASQLLLPFESTEETSFLFSRTTQTKPDQFLEHKEVSYDSEVNQFGIFDDFDAESILDEEIEEGIDSFMGSIESNDGESGFTGSGCYGVDPLAEMTTLTWHGSSLGLKNSLRECDDASLWRFPTVELEHISPRVQTTITTKSKTVATVRGEEKKKKKTMKEKVALYLKSSEDLKSKTEQRVSLFLKLDYDRVLEAWSDKESPLFSHEILGSEAAGSDDVHARLAEIDLFGDSGVREAIVLRYKEKRRNRLFSNSKRIRYQVRKLNADQRPRMKDKDSSDTIVGCLHRQGRFVRRSNVRNTSGLGS